MKPELSKKVIVFDFNRTLYDPTTGTLVSGALEVLQKTAPRFSLVLYTKSGEDRGRQIRDLGLKPFFKKTISVENKSAEDLVRLAKELNVKPGEIIVVGDRIHGEIIAGNKAGCKTVWFCSGKFAQEKPTCEAEKPTQTIFHLSELLELLD